MPESSATRAAAIARQGEAMREFMARAVLFQDAVARSAGLNGSDLQAVGLLLRDGPATPGELAARVGLTAGGAITAMIDRLERAGYVTRARDLADRRRVIVTAVPEALMSRVGYVYGRVADRWSEYLETLDDEQIDFATDLFARAAEINREEIEALRGAASGSDR
ncbi:DNA-binding Lrp family transcriptional regulator [Microbacterium resistens]|uniref:DNA-binding Lrp family transcriptional regulator n=1 Tax=Microbacterium resistens TaxID=156977 RepID=A0ABU1SG19_9MICO|nr:MarR family transcriptional regulator [Microbacterium resistens]MDR6868517.1 DNA-binding Lrp family transcriptional regulator [Microbacterium resistens]